MCLGPLLYYRKMAKIDVLLPLFPLSVCLDTKTACGKRKKLNDLLPGNVKIGTNMSLHSFVLTDKKKYIKNV